MKGIEIINILACVVIVVAVIPKNQLFFRIVNGIGSMLLITYGSLLIVKTGGETGYSTVALNAFCLALSIYHTIRILKERKNEKRFDGVIKDPRRVRKSR